jgi:hypothetical protein
MFPVPVPVPLPLLVLLRQLLVLDRTTGGYTELGAEPRPPRPERTPAGLVLRRALLTEAGALTLATELLAEGLW